MSRVITQLHHKNKNIEELGNSNHFNICIIGIPEERAEEIVQ
jgi:hypothetical protein